MLVIFSFKEVATFRMINIPSHDTNFVDVCMCDV